MLDNITFLLPVAHGALQYTCDIIIALYYGNMNN